MPEKDDLIAVYVTFAGGDGAMLRTTVETVMFSGQCHRIFTCDSPCPVDIERVAKCVMKQVARVMVKYSIGR